MLDQQHDFPVLDRRIDGRRVIYLDSAATSLNPRSVLDAQYRFSATIGANIRRSRHALGEEASYAFAQARRRVARFLSAHPSDVIFTSGATAALNLVARGISFLDHAVVLVPSIEHHSNLLPWMRSARTVVFRCDPREPLTPEQLEAEVIRHRPSLVAMSYVSNVTGVVHDAPALCRRLRALGVLSAVDASQAVGHFPLDVQEIGADFLAFSGHKMLGPFGTGVLWGRREELERLQPMMLGGGCVSAVTAERYALSDLPERLEAGTPNVTGVVGLAAAADYLESLGWEAVQAHERELTAHLDDIIAACRGILPMTSPRPVRTIALRSFTVDDDVVGAERLAAILSDSHNIMVRAGFHCAHPLFEQEGRGAAVRVSAYLYNTVQELTLFGEAIQSVLARFARR